MKLWSGPRFWAQSDLYSMCVNFYIIKEKSSDRKTGKKTGTHKNEKYERGKPLIDKMGKRKKKRTQISIGGLFDKRRDKIYWKPL